MSETTETLRDLELVAFRRVGANRVHFALVMPETMHEATHWGAACTMMDGPVLGFCGRTSRGAMFVIPSEKLDSWRRGGDVCRECKLTARVALAQIDR